MNQLIDSIRLRPAMYIGSRSIRGFDVLLRQIICEAFGHFKAKRVTFRIKGKKKGEFVITDPEEPMTYISFVEMFVLRPDQIFDDLLIVVLNALSSSFLLEIIDIEGTSRTLEFEKGCLVSGRSIGEPCVVSSIRCEFDLDDSIWEEGLEMNPYYYMDFIQTHGFLNKDKKIEIEFVKDGKSCNVIYDFPNGLADLLEIKRRTSIFGDFYYPSHLEFKTEEFEAEIAYALWENSINLPFTISYVNHQISPENGVHLDAVFEGVWTSLNEYLNLHFGDAELAPISLEALQRALNCAVHVKMPRPNFYGSYRGKLLSPEVVEPINAEVSAKLTSDLNSDPIKAKEVITYLSRNATLNRQ